MNGDSSTDSAIQFRYAERADVPAIVALLSDDVLGAGREQPVGDGIDVYLTAFDAMRAQGNNNYLLAVNAEDEVLGCLQITIIPGLSRSGAKRAQLEGVRVASTARGRGIGHGLFSRAHEIARQEGCSLVQLTTDKSREDALRFYESLGYISSHHGMKLTIA